VILSFGLFLAGWRTRQELADRAVADLSRRSSWEISKSPREALRPLDAALRECCPVRAVGHENLHGHRLVRSVEFDGDFNEISRDRPRDYIFS